MNAAWNRSPQAAPSSPPHSPTPQQRRAKRRSIAGLTLAALLAALGTSIANVALPSLAREFAVAPAQAQWVVLSYLLTMTATAVQVGRLGDRLGRQRTLVMGMGVFLIATLACAAAPSFATLIGARAVQGVGAAVLVALPLALARDLGGTTRLGAIMGALGAAAAVGTSLGPAAGGLLLELWGWQSMFYGVLPVGLAALALLSRPLALALPDAGTPGSSAIVRGPVRLGTLGLLRDWPFTAALIMNLLVATVMMSTLIVGPFFLAAGLGLSVGSIGLAMALGPAVAAVSGVLAGRVVDRRGATWSTAAGLGIMVAGMLALVSLPVLLGLAGYLIALVILTPGYQLFLAANNTAALMKASRETRGAASGLLSLSRNLGLIAGASVMGALYGAVFDDVVASGGGAAGAAFGGAQMAFALGAGFVGLALAVAWSGARTTRLATGEVR
ncbi:putative MFS family arabinose efflux permease [Leucobacter luti]|nr:putative MFS family arabinose efflux permease [Leucobacter luti]